MSARLLCLLKKRRAKRCKAALVSFLCNTLWLFEGSRCLSSLLGVRASEKREESEGVFVRGFSANHKHVASCLACLACSPKGPYLLASRICCCQKGLDSAKPWTNCLAGVSCCMCAWQLTMETNMETKSVSSCFP